MNLQDFYTGNEFEAYKYFGANKTENGTVFRTYAPAAVRVCIIGEFNGWNEEEMTALKGGIFEYTSHNAQSGMLYRFVIYKRNGIKSYHSDPYGRQMELRPNSASIIRDLDSYNWTDSEWMENRSKNFNSPLNIYEVHLGSWKSCYGNYNDWHTYTSIADELIDYVLNMGFTHIEFLPLCEHPADCSWGYQTTGFFAPTSRYGTPDMLRELINKCHNRGIGVILDFVPVHFAIDDYALRKYDGTDLYEFPDSDTAISEWGSCNFNHSRGEVSSLLKSSVNYWLKEFHFDGIRMDAISRAIYWLGDEKRGVNSRAVEFIQSMNKEINERFPTAMLIAEDSTAYLKVSAPVEYDGLGFDYKWDLGFMNDTLNFFKTPPEERPREYYKLFFSMEYFYSEKYILPFSHDESVHGKATIIQKMWGDYDNKWGQAKALYLYMFTHPGKKLNFMGNEIAQFREWDEKREQDWDLLKYPKHNSFNRFFRDISLTYKGVPSLHKDELSTYNFKWVGQYQEECIYAYMVGIGRERVLTVLNLSDKDCDEFVIDEKGKIKSRILINTELQIYGGEVGNDMETFSARYIKKSRSTRFTFNLKGFSGIAVLLSS